MNCPYCNKQCSLSEYESGLDIFEYFCSHCLGKPLFLQWNEFSYYKYPSSMHHMFFRVSFFYDDLLFARFSPQSKILEVWSLDKDFNIDHMVTPDNIMQTLDRLNNLKAFL